MITLLTAGILTPAKASKKLKCGLEPSNLLREGIMKTPVIYRFSLESVEAAWVAVILSKITIILQWVISSSIITIITI